MLCQMFGDCLVKRSPTFLAPGKIRAPRTSLATVRWSIAYQRSFGLDTERSSAFFNLIGVSKIAALNRHKKEHRAI
jgi:hypothetical protein